LRLGILLAEDSGGKRGGDDLARAVEMLRQMDMKFWLKAATEHKDALLVPPSP
jgi:hypothetical protein